MCRTRDLNVTCKIVFDTLKKIFFISNLSLFLQTLIYSALQDGILAIYYWLDIYQSLKVRIEYSALGFEQNFCLKDISGCGLKKMFIEHCFGQRHNANFADSRSTEFLTKTDKSSNNFYANYLDRFKSYHCENVVYRSICNGKSSRDFIETELVLW